jgi:pimeloyl-ACP methyl ester carboxylesterase
MRDHRARHVLAAAGALIAASLLPALAEAPRTATRGDAVIAYTDQGTGPAILVVPSLGRGCGDFDQVTALLVARHYRVLCAQPRGIGDSKGALPNPTLHEYAADLAAVLRQAAGTPVVVLGHAYGNIVARTLAAEEPTLVRGVILVAASGRAPLSAETRKAIDESSDLTVPDAERVKALATAYFASGHDASVWLQGWYPQAQAAQWVATKASKPDDYIAAGGKVPILDVQGDHDVIIPAKYSQDLHHELGDRVTVVVLADAGHALVPEQPVALVAAIDTWMQMIR